MATQPTQAIRSINLAPVGLTVLIGSILTLAGCKPQAKQTAQAPVPPANSTAATNQIAIKLPDAAPLPVPPNTSTNLPLVPLKSLEPLQTNAQTAPDRLSQPLKPSTRDPFSVIPPVPMEPPLQATAPQRLIAKLNNKAKSLLKPKAKPTNVATAPTKPQPTKPQSPKPVSKQPKAPMAPQVMPQVSIAPLPVQPVMMPPVPIAPIAPAPAAPAAPPVVSLVDQVEITGVAQVGSQLLVVARGPGESSARTIAPGSYLSSGRILVKAVRQEGKDPVVVLVENGVETVRSVSGSRAMSMR